MTPTPNDSQKKRKTLRQIAGERGVSISSVWKRTKKGRAYHRAYQRAYIKTPKYGAYRRAYYKRTHVPIVVLREKGLIV